MEGRWSSDRLTLRRTSTSRGKWMSTWHSMGIQLKRNLSSNPTSCECNPRTVSLTLSCSCNPKRKEPRRERWALLLRSPTPTTLHLWSAIWMDNSLVSKTLSNLKKQEPQYLPLFIKNRSSRIRPNDILSVEESMKDSRHSFRSRCTAIWGEKTRTLLTLMEFLFNQPLLLSKWLTLFMRSTIVCSKGTKADLSSLHLVTWPVRGV
jgi:hypothetical protein